jgi:hypothetical protein
MKVRKFLFAGALLVATLFSVNSVMAETGPVATAPVTVNLKFMPVQSIYVNAAQKTIDFVFKSEDNYKNGADAVDPQAAHLTVFSSGGFVVSLETSGANFTSGTTTTTIPVGHVSVKAKASGVEGSSFGDAVPLSNSSTPFITSTKGGIDLKYDVEYENTGFDPAVYINGYNKNSIDTEEATVFTTQLTYTIATN